MSSDIILEEVNFDEEFADLVPENLISSLNIKWLLWEINTTTPDAEKDCQNLIQLMKKRGTTTLKYTDLNEIAISPTKNKLIRNLIKNGLCIISNTDLQIQKRNLTRSRLPEIKDQIRQIYSGIIEKREKGTTHLPSGEFVTLADHHKTTVELTKLNLMDLSSEEMEQKLIELKFQDNRLPSVLFNPEDIKDLVSASSTILIRSLMKYAGDKDSFFNTCIARKTNPALNENARIIQDISIKSNNKSARNYREQYTRAVLERVFEKPEASASFIRELSTTFSNHIYTRYSYDNPNHFNFLQCFNILMEYYLHSKELAEDTIQTLLRNVGDDIKLYITEEDLKWQILGTEEDMTDGKYSEIYARFLREYTSFRGNRSPLILRFEVSSVGGKKETILIHTLNIIRFLDAQLVKISDRFNEYLHINWKTKIREHTIIPAMLDADAFKAYLLKYIEEDFPLFFSLLRKPLLYTILEQNEKITHPVDLLRLHGLEGIDAVLKTKGIKLYRILYNEVLQEYSPFRRFFFRIIQWFNRQEVKRKIAPRKKKNPEEHKEEQIELRTKQIKEYLFNSTDSEDTQSLQSKLDKLWNKIPHENINRLEVEQNIAGDLHSFFQGKENVPVNSLKVVIESNVNRIISKAQYLNAYSHDIEGFIKSFTYYSVLKSPHFFEKCRL